VAHKDLSVPYHQQDTDYYCGAACAQMVLNSIGGPLYDQAPLYASNHSHSTTEPGWYTGPDGLQWTLNNMQTGRYFALDALNSEDSISRMIAWTIHDWKVAPVALVYGSDHWIVVRGYSASNVPRSSADTSYTLCAFDVNNPWPPTPEPGPPPPHSNGTDGCGTGGARGIADEYISYSEWRSTYMTGVPSGYWGGKFVAVCDPAPPPDLPQAISEPTFAPQTGRLLTGDEVRDQARNAIELSCLFENPFWEQLLARMELAQPFLVQRLDRADDYYWVVPTVGTERPAFLSLDGLTGTVRQAIALPSGASWDWAANDPRRASSEALADILTARLRDVCDLREQIVVRPEAISVHPTLVWQPCRESLSPFGPFAMITLGQQRVYWRLIDGAVFTSLTLGERGL